VLSTKEEKLLAQLSEITGASDEIFTMLNNADMRFGEVKDEKGAKVELTHGNYINFMESKERKVRKGAYLAMYAQYEKYKNTLATSYSYNTKTDVVTSRIRAYDSSLARSLSADNVPLGVYDNLIEQVNESLPLMHRYMDIKAKLLGQSKLAMYDIYAPLFNLRSDKCSWDKALELMATGLSPLGASYVKTALDGANDGWIDVYENVGKTSGAYSFGSYDSKPYILMNYSEKLKDVFTLVHEMGHSMHSYYTRKKQPFRYGGHSIFTAEVASTVNESLLIHHLQAKSKGKNEQKYFINMHIDDFRTTLFRQTMFAEFEKITHEAAEAGEVLTADLLSNEYGKLNEKYYGPRVFTDEQIRVEWARIPHFYRAFYVYKYATGYSAATAISSKLLAGGNAGASAVKDYHKFLESGESDDPIELLRIAGVDMDQPEPVANAMSVFGGLVEKLEGLI
jgi:oligoendopeptidase F